MNVDWVCHIRVDIVNASRGYHIEIREAHNNHESKNISASPMLTLWMNGSARNSSLRF